MIVRRSWIGLVCALLVAPALGQTAGSFSVQGLLKDAGGDPISGMVDLQFRLFDAESGGSLVDWNGDGFVDDIVGLDAWEVLDVEVAAGLFVAKPGGALSPTAFDGNARFLEISVREDVTYVTLSRLEIATAPATAEQLNQPASGTPALRIETDPTSPNLIGGFSGNSVTAGAVGATIGGGGQSTATNRVFDDYGTVGGGGNNKAGSDDADPATAIYATVGGGVSNAASYAFATVGGGVANEAAGENSTVSGGIGNDAVADESNVSGGLSNNASGSSSTVGGGAINTASGDTSTVGGGLSNNAIASSSTVSGGNSNTAGGSNATVAGGTLNTASGSSSTVAGGESNTAVGNFSLAAGRRAKANHDGSFVWADSTDADFASTGPDQFLIRAAGGVGVTGNVEASGTIKSGNSITIDGLTDTINSTGNLKLQTGGTTRVYLNNATGNVGIGTTNPYSELSLFGASPVGLYGGQLSIKNSETSGDAGTGGGIAFRAHDGTTMNNAVATIHGLKENSTAGNLDGYLAFNTREQADNIRERMRITSTGLVGIGDSTPDAALDVVGDINYTGIIVDVSDERLKENIAPVRDALRRLLELRGVYFNMIDNPDQREVGLIAQNVQKVLPEAVSVIDQETGHLGVSYPSLIALLVEAIKEMRSEQDARVANQQKEINELRDRLITLETLIATDPQQRASSAFVGITPALAAVCLIGFVALNRGRKGGAR